MTTSEALIVFSFKVSYHGCEIPIDFGKPQKGVYGSDGYLQTTEEYPSCIAAIILIFLENIYPQQERQLIQRCDHEGKPKYRCVIKYFPYSLPLSDKFVFTPLSTEYVSAAASYRLSQLKENKEIASIAICPKSFNPKMGYYLVTTQMASGAITNDLKSLKVIREWAAEYFNAKRASERKVEAESAPMDMHKVMRPSAQESFPTTSRLYDAVIPLLLAIGDLLRRAP